MKTVRYRSAGGIVIHKGQVLLLDRPDRNEIRLPKGHIERDETPQTAALRETAEEGGYADLEIVANLGHNTVEFDYRNKHVIRDEYYFVMRLQSEKITSRPVGDEEQFRPLWIPLDRAETLLTFEAERRVVRRARDAIEST